MSDLDLRLLIEAALKDKGLVDLRSRLDSVEKQVHKARGATDRLRASFQQFGRYVTGFFAAGIITRFASSSINEFARIERQINATAFTMRRLGFDAAAELPEVVKQLKAIRDAGGPLLADTFPVFQRFVTITKDVSAAMAATKLATDLAESGMLDARSAGEQLANILQGRATDAAKRLGIELLDLNGEIKTNAQLLEEVIELYRSLGSSMDDTAVNQSKLAAKWEEFKLQFGSFLRPTLRWILMALSGIVKSIKSMPALSDLVVQKMVAGFKYLGRVVGIVWDSIRHLKFKDIATRMQEAFNDAFDEVKDRVAADADEIVELWMPAGEESGKEYAEGYRKFLDQARRKADAQDRANQAKAVERQRKWGEQQAKAFFEAQRKEQEAALRAFEEDQKRRLEIAEAEKTFRNTMAQELAQIDIEFAENATERRKAELDALKVEEEMRLDSALKNNEDVAKVVEFYRKKRLLINKRFSEAEELLEEAKRKQTEEQALAAAEGAINALTVLFGEHKALSVAQAVINTYAGAAKALEQGGIFGAAMAAIIIATGLGYVRKIESTNPAAGGFGGGGGGGGGAVPAGSFAAPQSAAAPSTAAAAAGAPGAREARSGDTINVYSTVIDDLAIKRLGRKIDRAKRRDNAARRIQ